MQGLTDNKTLQDLEYSRILDLLAGYSLSERGGQIITDPHFHDNFRDCEIQQIMVKAVESILQNEEYNPARLPEISEELELISKEGKVLEGSQLAKLAYYISNSCECLDFFSRTDNPAELYELLSCEKPYHVSTEIYSCFDTDGTILSSLPEIKKITRLIADLEKKNDDLLKKYLNDWSGYLMFSNPSLKEGRHVLPVKAEYKNRTKGVIHQVSNTGSTVFIEPLEILENNNALLEANAEYERIILSYCRQMSALLHSSSAEITRLAEVFTMFDCLYMRARFLKEYECIYPGYVKSGFRILQARHLLLPGKPVPLDILLKHPLKALVISGSNAGGKTVALKTMGLCVLMNQAAIPVPAAEGSSLCFFDFLAADIGDSQSIEESRSTFSGHLMRIRDIISGNRKKGLVLLDELGTGTSDEEGAALGISFLENIGVSGNRIIATTHNRKIKEYAFGNDLTETASVNYSEEKHIPVYGLSYGIHGDSHGIDTAIQCGMPEKIINDARDFLLSESGELDLALQKIKEMEDVLRKKETELDDVKANLMSQQEYYKTEVEKLEKARISYKTELEELIIDINRKIDGLKAGKINIARKDESGLKEQVYDKLDSIEPDIAETSNKPDPSFRPEKGLKVFVSEYNSEGILIDQSKKGKWLVQLGNMKITLDEKKLLPSREKDVKSEPVLDKGLSVANAPSLLDLRGKTVEESIELLARHLDSMVAGGQTYFSVIHGHGPLQHAVRDYLKKQQLVKKISFAEQNNGGRGKSLIYLDN